MPTLAQIRQQYPGYDDLTDQQLAQGLHKKFYSDLSFEDFQSRLGIPTKDTQKPQDRIGVVTPGIPTGPSREVERRARAEGPPVLTEELKKLAANLAPIALSTAGSLLAPQIALPIRAVSAAPKLASLVSSFLGGTVGGAAGGAVEATIEETPIVQQAIKRGKESAIGEVAGAGISKVAGLPFRFIRGGTAVSKEGQVAAEFAAKEGLSISPADVFPSKATQQIQKAAEQLPFSKGRMDVIRETLETTGGNLSLPVRRIVELEARDIVPQIEKVSEDAANVLRGKLEVGETGRKVIDEETEAAFNKFISTIGGKTKTQASGVQEVLTNILARESQQEIKEEAIVKFAEGFLERSKAGITADDLFETFRRLDRLAPRRGATPQQKNYVGQISRAFKAQFEQLADTPGALKLLTEANLTSTFGRALKSSPALKKAASEGNAQGVTRALFSSKDPTLIRGVKARLDEGQFNSLLSVNLADIISLSSIKGKTGSDFLNGEALLKKLDSMPKFVKNMYSKQTMEAIENLAIYAKLSKTALKTEPQGLLGATIAGIGGIGLASIPGDIPGLPDQPTEQLGAAAGAIVLARMLTNPKSRLTQFLLTGKGGAIASQLPRIAAKALVQGE